MSSVRQGAVPASQLSRALWMYELMLGCTWAEVRMKLESAYADKLPDTLTPEALKEMLDDYDDEDEKGRNCLKAARPCATLVGELMEITCAH